MAIITISRGTLSGGRVVAECLANGLGYPCVAREVLQEAAQTLGASEETVRAKLEVPPGLLARLTGERWRYLTAVQSALADQCAAGDLVYHGLAGQFLLRNLASVLRVRLIAPMAFRVRALLRTHHRTSRRGAERFIRRIDRARDRWVHLMYGSEVDAPCLYHLTINLETVTVESACALIAELADQPLYRRTEESTEQLKAFARECKARLKAARRTIRP